jgi:hypothetical protein
MVVEVQEQHNNPCVGCGRDECPIKKDVRNVKEIALDYFRPGIYHREDEYETIFGRQQFIYVTYNKQQQRRQQQQQLLKYLKLLLLHHRYHFIDVPGEAFDDELGSSLSLSAANGQIADIGAFELMLLNHKPFPPSSLLSTDSAINRIQWQQMTCRMIALQSEPKEQE